jgi:hypothetical protein
MTFTGCGDRVLAMVRAILNHFAQKMDYSPHKIIHNLVKRVSYRLLDKRPMIIQSKTNITDEQPLEMSARSCSYSLHINLTICLYARPTTTVALALFIHNNPLTSLALDAQ